MAPNQSSEKTGAFASLSLTVTDFRNHAGCRIEVSGGQSVVLTGPNGAGKTNLLEALSFLSPGRGLRRANLAQIGRISAPEGSRWSVAARVRSPDALHHIGTGLDPSAPEGTFRRTVRVDGETLPSQANLGTLLAVTWLTPQMDRLFIEGSSQRRRFFDRLVNGFVPGHAARLSAYDNALRQRSKLLRDGPEDPVWLGQLEAAMVESGVAVAAARRQTADRLSAAETGDFGRVAAFPKAAMALSGALEEALVNQPALAVEDWFRGRLSASRREDAAAGRATTGPHRTDLLVHNVDKDVPADQCSTGEQKALLIALVLAQARLMTRDRGSPPILLLDEVAAHLDSGRRAALYSAISDLGAQAWMTGTEAALFEPARSMAQFLTVMDGVVTDDPGIS
ncbi:MAG: DNA replication/repair protein RecF [Pseudomonadota bacterium]